MVRIQVAGEHAAFIRLHYGDDEAWSDLVATAMTPNQDGFIPYVQLVNDSALDGLSPEQVRRDMPTAYQQHYAFIADAETFLSDLRPILVLDLQRGSSAMFRTMPVGVQSIDNNLSISNMDFDEFARHAEENGGVFDGFSPPGGAVLLAPPVGRPLDEQIRHSVRVRTLGEDQRELESE